MAEFIEVTRSGGVAVICLNRPKVNALCRALLVELTAALNDLRTDPPGAVVITGSERFFAAGADIAEFGGPDEAAEIGQTIIAATAAIEAFPRIVIAAVSGVALGGGCELALACDLRIAADNAVFGQPEILLGIIPGGGGTQRLPRLVGPARAKELVLSGRQVKADEALRIGLCEQLLPTEGFLAAAVTYAQSYASGAVLAQAAAKHAIDAGLTLPIDQGMALEHEAFVDIFRTEDARAGVASFLANGPGKATFTGT